MWNGTAAAQMAQLTIPAPPTTPYEAATTPGVQNMAPAMGGSTLAMEIQDHSTAIEVGLILGLLSVLWGMWAVSLRLNVDSNSTRRGGA